MSGWSMHFWVDGASGGLSFRSNDVLRQSAISVLFLMMGIASGFAQNAERYFMVNSKITFVSKASLETIEAASTAMKGVLDVKRKSFAFSVNSASFEGFNSTLQKDHFNENYIESERYPQCTFTGKLIDEMDFRKDGKYIVRAKGMLTIKGVPHEQIIKAIVIVNGSDLTMTAGFTIALTDHEIRIPRIVQQKIAPQILVNVDAQMRQEVAK
jgi:hypothetical protein